MLSCLSPFLSATVIFVLFGVGALAETFPRSAVHSSSERAYIYCSAGGLGWYPFENGSAGCRDWPLVVSPGSSTLLILCNQLMAIGLTRTPGNSSSIDSFGLIPRTGNLTLTIINPPPTETITFESRCENPAPAETKAQKNAWKVPNNLNPKAAPEFGPCCVLEFNVSTTYIGDLYYQSITGDLFYGPMIIEANVTSTTTTTTTPPTNNTTPDSGTTTTNTTTTTPVPTSTPLPPDNTTTTGVPTSTPTPTPTMSSTPTPTMVTNTTLPPTTINPPNDGANFALASLSSYCCTVLTTLVVILFF